MAYREDRYGQTYLDTSGLNSLESAAISAQKTLFQAQKDAAGQTIFDPSDIRRLVDSIGATDVTLGGGFENLDEFLGGGPAGSLFGDIMAQLAAASEAGARNQAGNYISSQGGAGGFAQQAIANQLVASGGANGAASQAEFILGELNRQRDLRYQNQDSVLGALKLALNENQFRLQGPDTGQVTNISNAISAAQQADVQRRIGEFELDSAQHSFRSSAELAKALQSSGDNFGAVDPTIVNRKLRGSGSTAFLGGSILTPSSFA